MLSRCQLIYESVCFGLSIDDDKNQLSIDKASMLVVYSCQLTNTNQPFLFLFVNWRWKNQIINLQGLYVGGIIMSIDKHKLAVLLLFVKCCLCSRSVINQLRMNFCSASINKPKKNWSFVFVNWQEYTTNINTFSIDNNFFPSSIDKPKRNG